MRKESGGLSSQFYRDVENENALCVLEQWVNQSDLDAHLRSINFNVLRGALRLLNGPAEMRFHSVSRTLGEEAVEAANEVGLARDRRRTLEQISEFFTSTWSYNCSTNVL
ncbi:MAG: antibiotic biosynthesis monooxygenase [Deltaproteobacteria bacterium]|nr:antibiotic biosynthesis monooxygenase [Deltaproteobacteria bacterium]